MLVAPSAIASRCSHTAAAPLRAGLALFALLFLISAPAPVHAQPCSADSQCRDFGRERTWCSGNALVTRKSICAGTCRSVEVSRVPCPGPCVADRCIGGPLSSPGEEPPLGDGRLAPSGACANVCVCKGKRLTYAIGYARRAEQCRRRTVDCVFGCTCDPEPRCLKRDERCR